MKKGTIGLDIDGTITAAHHTLSSAVAHYLESLTQEGWQLVFITGRPFQWGYSVLQVLQCSYLFAVQNGAIILEMPNRRVMVTQYLDSSIFPGMESICSNEPSDFVIYGGFEYDDICYYRPEYFEENLRDYVRRRREMIGEKWIAVDSFNEIDISSFPSVKCFGMRASVERIARRIETELKLHVPLIRDPFHHDYFVAQATHSKADKGYALRYIVKTLGLEEKPVIAAGDDRNDLPMLEQAQIRIVMATAPPEMQEGATIVAPSALDDGIIQGLQEALRLLQ